MIRKLKEQVSRKRNISIEFALKIRIIFGVSEVRIPEVKSSSKETRTRLMVISSHLNSKIVKVGSQSSSKLKLLIVNN